MSKQLNFILFFLLIVSVSFSQNNNWDTKVEWNSFEVFKKNKKKQISLILIEGDKQLDQKRIVDESEILNILSDFNCTKLKLGDQPISFKGQKFKQDDDEIFHQFEKYLLGDHIDEKKYRRPLIVILDSQLNTIQFEMLSLNEDEKKVHDILLESERVKLQYLKDNIEDKTHNAIQRQERTLENIAKRKELSTSVSVFNARMYNNFQLPLLLKYFSENHFY